MTETKQANTYPPLVESLPEAQEHQERAALIREQAARTLAEATQWRFAFLAEASTLLAASLDYETTLANVADLVVPHLADWCFVYVVGEDTSISQVAVAHIDKDKVKQAQKLHGRYPPDPNAARGVAGVLRNGKSEIYAEVSEALLEEVARDREHLEILKKVQIKSVMLVPMKARGQTLGAIAFITSESDRHYAADDLALAEDLASRAALAVDNARLYREAELAAYRTARLQAVTVALGSAITVARVAEVVVEQAIASLSASCGLIALLNEAENTLEIVHAIGYPIELAEAWSSFHINTPVPLAESVQTGEAIFIPTKQVWDQRYPHLASAATITGNRAFAAIPLMVDGQAVGAMGLSFDDSKHFGADDCAFMVSLAQQCAQAMERAYLYEAEQRAREAAEASNRMKDEFLAIVSHELRTPLNSMLGWASLLRSRKFDEATTARAIETIERNAKLQKQLIEDILDVSRMMQGQMRLNIQPVPLAQVIQDSIHGLVPSAQAKSIQLLSSIKNEGAMVAGDQNRLQQVVWNLLGNAIKFTPSGGRVEIELSVVMGNGEEEEIPHSPFQNPNSKIEQSPISYAQIRVSDTGNGISPSFLPFVFERFRQENSSTTRSHGGLGLGLAIVRQLVELHGGMVAADSLGLGLGATFTVLLPLLKKTK